MRSTKEPLRFSRPAICQVSLARRSATLTAEVRCFGDRLAAWDHMNRPSLDDLLAEAGVEV